MRLPAQITGLILSIAVFLGGCGPDDSSTSSVAASILVPRLLADDLTLITIYVIETDKETHQPDCTVLLGDIDAYKSARREKEKEVVFDPQGTSVLISGIPDRGRVWRFYARGFQDQTLIAHGCEDGLRDVPANDTIEVTITIESVN